MSKAKRDNEEPTKEDQQTLSSDSQPADFLLIDYIVAEHLKKQWSEERFNGNSSKAPEEESKREETKSINMIKTPKGVVDLDVGRQVQIYEERKRKKISDRENSNNRLDIMEQVIIYVYKENNQNRQEVRELQEKMKKLEEKVSDSLKIIYQIHFANVTALAKYKARFDEVLDTLGCLDKNNFQNEINEFLINNSGKKSYFYTLYWWLITLLKAFGLNRGGFVDINSDLLTDPKHKLLKKLFNITRNSLGIATSSVHAIGQVVSLVNWVSDDILKKHEQNMNRKMAEGVSDIFEDILIDTDLQKLLIRSVMKTCKAINIGKEEELGHLKRFKFFLGGGKFEKRKLLYEIGKSGYKDYQKKLAIYHALGLVRYLYKHHDEITGKRDLEREDLLSRIVLNESWME